MLSNYLIQELKKSGIFIVEKRKIAQQPWVDPVCDIERGSVTHSFEYKLWRGMISRCYNINNKDFYNYGGRGVFVENRWLLFSNFVSDLKELPNWGKKQEDFSNYHLDKDYYSSNAYSKDTCVWLSRKANALYTQTRGLLLIHPRIGESFYSLSLKDAAEKLNVTGLSLSRSLRNRTYSKEGHKVRLIDGRKDYAYRYKLLED